MNIRTVVSLGKEELFWKKYLTLLDAPYGYSLYQFIYITYIFIFLHAQR